MLIPSIDLMGGKIVQLVQGKTKALEFDNFEQWVERFSIFPLIQLIDLDAALGSGSNHQLVQYFVERLPCQVGGGIRSIPAAQEILELGAKRVIFGSSLIRAGQINTGFAKEAAEKIGPERLVFALDSKEGKVAIRGWRELTEITPLQMIRALDSGCAAFLYTHIDTEGMMLGIPLQTVRALRQATSKQLIVAGGISSEREVQTLDSLSVDAVVGMALYLGKFPLSQGNSLPAPSKR